MSAKYAGRDAKNAFCMIKVRRTSIFMLSVFLKDREGFLKQGLLCK